jgi:hypothetical protein
MNERIKDFFLLMFVRLIMPVFWLSIQYGILHERVKEMYYRFFGIPYHKDWDKFLHYTVKRIDR